MTNLLTRKWLYASSAVFLISLLTGIYFEFYYVALIPFALFVLWAAFFHLESIVYFIFFSTPVSINLEELKLGGIGVALPTEPILVGVLVLFIFKTFSGKSIDKRIFTHPISYVLYAYLAWMALTCITSEMPVVSIKYLTTRLWFIAAMFFIIAHLYKNYARIQHTFLLYIFPLLGVVIYTVVRHSMHDFDKDSSHWVMEPIFKDHTSYGAVLAMYFPISVGLLLSRRLSLMLRTFLIIAFIILTAGLILSYTRAAWISVIGAGGILVIMLLKIQLRTIVLAGVVASGFLCVSWDTIQMSLERNKQESSDKLDEHVSSISNVSSDASNLERLNRWHCALEMFKERPLVGWGPGTYQFVYAPFQRSGDRTIISTNRGDGGNAHSEYLGPLSEQGVPGMITVIILLLAVSHYGFKLFFELKDREIKITAAAAYLGLMTYFIHGVLNNYLDTDKASIPFWSFIAVLVAIDLYHRDKQLDPLTLKKATGE